MVEHSRHKTIVYEIFSESTLNSQIMDIRKSQDGFRNCCLIMSQILQALNFMNSKGVVHRMLNPKSIFFLRKGDFRKLKVGNFENMVMLTEKEQSTEASLQANDNVEANERESIFMFYGISYDKVLESVRTLDDNLIEELDENSKFYVAPELLKQDMYDQKADIWSAGIIFYELLTEKLPFNEGKFDPDFELLAEYPDFITDLLPKMLETDPNQRVDIIELLASLDKIEKYLIPGDLNSNNGNYSEMKS